VPARTQAGVVNEDVDRAELVDGCLDHLGGVVVRRDVRLDRQRSSIVLLFDGRRNRFGGIDVDVGDSDVRVVCGEGFTDCPTDTARTAGHGDTVICKVELLGE